MDKFIGKLVTGKQFNEMALKKHNLSLVKLTNEKEVHNEFPYMNGLNTDTHKFCPALCVKGGLCFTSLENIHFWIDYTGGSYTIIVNKKIKHVRYPDNHMCWIREVIVPDDATICIHNSVFKTDKFILKEKKSIWDNYKLCLYIVIKDGLALRFIYQSSFSTSEYDEICISALKQTINASKYIKFETRKIKQYMNTVKNNIISST